MHQAHDDEAKQAALPTRGLGRMLGRAKPGRPRSRESQPLQAGAEQAEHELGCSVEGPLRQRSGPDAFGSLQGNFEHQELASPYLEITDLLPLLYRRVHRAGINHPCDVLVARAAGDHQPHLFLPDQRDVSFFAAIDLGPRALLTLADQQSRLEVVKSPLEKLLGLVRALLLRLQAVDDDNQSQPVLYRRTHETITRFPDEAGLETVGSALH